MTFGVLFVCQTYIGARYYPRRGRIEFYRTLTHVRAHIRRILIFIHKLVTEMPAPAGRRYLTAALFNGVLYFSRVSTRARSTAKNVQTERNETIVYNDCGIANRKKKSVSYSPLILFRTGCEPAAMRRLHNDRPLFLI